MNMSMKSLGIGKSRAIGRTLLGAAMALMIRVYLEGLYGEAPDEGKAAQWAARERHARLGER